MQHQHDSQCFFQVAAVDEPKLHMWETGVMRITRHPQSFGQALWCFAHTLWIGSSFMVATSGVSPCASAARACRRCRVRAMLQYVIAVMLRVAALQVLLWRTTCSLVGMETSGSGASMARSAVLSFHVTTTCKIISACGILALDGLESHGLALDAHLAQRVAQLASMKKHSLQTQRATQAARPPAVVLTKQTDTLKCP